MSTSTFKACVIGNPIAQSKSPIIHKMFAEQFDLPLEYSKREAAVSGFVESAEAFFADPTAVGANVTMPFKHDALAWVHSLSSQAERAGAVNTIIRTEHGFIGDNSDGVGLVNDLLNHNIKIDGAKLLMIGAGGASKGALPALLDAGLSSVHIYNRSHQKAVDLVNYTKDHTQAYIAVHPLQTNQPSAFESFEQSMQFDIIINATSLSLGNQLPALPDTIFEGSPAVYDMVYLNQETVFLQKAKSLNCKTAIDGLGMLVEQAAHSFFLWFGKKPETREVYKYLRAMSQSA